MLLCDFARTKGAKDKQPRKKRKAKEILRGGYGGATAAAGGMWTLSEGLKAFRKTKGLGRKIGKFVPRSAVAGLLGGATLAALKSRKKRKQ